MRVFSVLAAIACLCLAASAADAGTYVYKISGTLDDGSTEFSGWFTFSDVPDDLGSGSVLGVYTDSTDSFIEWEMTIDGTTYESGGSDFESDTIYVLDDTEDSLLIYSSYDSLSLDLEFVDSDADAFDGVDLDGCTMKVNEAQERRPRGGGGGGRGGGRDRW